MRTRSSIATILVVILGCSHTPELEKNDGFSPDQYSPEAIALNDRAMDLAYPKELKGFRDTSQFPQAIALLDSALQLNATYSGAYWTKFTLLCQLGRRAEVISNFEKWLKYVPGHAGAWQYLGMTYEAGGQFGLAESCYSKSLNICQKAYDSHPNYWDLAKAVVDLNALLKRQSVVDSLLVTLKRNFRSEADDWVNLYFLVSPENIEERIGHFRCK